jgi:23S rRNA pseudouridine1911/1915/1917 synthase
VSSPISIIVSDDEAGSRLDALLSRRGGMPRSRAAELIALGAVTVEGRRESKAYRVGPGQVIRAQPDEAPTRIPEPTYVEVVFEDEHLLVASKPAGLVVHAAPGTSGPTLVDALRARGMALADRGEPERPGIVHRLDKDVSGLILVAKTAPAHEALQAAIARRLVKREYLALVSGVPATSTGKIDAPVGRNPRNRARMAVVADGRPAATWFRVRERLRDCSLLEVELETGRTHQIRVHLASIGHPLLGDPVYGRPAPGLDRPFLHAAGLAFDHPATGARVELRSPLPPDLQGALERFRQ